MLEAPKGGNSEHFKCPDNASYLPRGKMVLLFFTTGWECGTIQPLSRCNDLQKRQLKEMDAH